MPTDALKWNRYYVEFTRTGEFKNLARTTPDVWLTSLKESPLLTLDRTTITGWRYKPYARTPIESTGGRDARNIDTKGGQATGVGVFSNVIDVNAFVTAAKVPFRQERWTHQGVQAGDSLVIHSRKTNCDARLTICLVNSDSQITVAESPALCASVTYVNWTTLSCTPWVNSSTPSGTPRPVNILNVLHIRYRIVRQKPRGELAADDWYNGPNTFWEAEGPGAGSGNVRVHVPTVTPGAATLNGATGYIPDIMDGMAAATQLEWEYGAVIFSTDANTIGGMGRKFNYNNRDFAWEWTKIKFRATDLRYIRYQ